MFSITIASVLLTSLVAWASPMTSASNEDCRRLKEAQTRLAVAGSNLANAKTTRTPLGGAYRKRIVVGCQRGQCEIRASEFPELVYDPKHPDADEEGYVEFPGVDVKAEYAAFNVAATKIRLLARSGACGSKDLSVVALASWVQYNSKGVDGKVEEDVFNFTSRNEVVSWQRVDSRGRASTINFMPDGKVSSVQRDASQQ